MKEIFLPTLHEGQLTVWADSWDARLNAIRCGRRWGKTFMLVSAAVTYATSSFKRPGMDIELGGRVGIFTAEYRQYQEIFDKLAEILEPLIKSKSRSEKRILLTNGGKIDFWVTNDNKLAGRGREYELVLIDEAAFTKSDMLGEIWPKSIKPTLLTTRGRAYVFSTPDGIEEDNFFYAICNNKSLGFVEHHAPTSSNPFVPPEELEKERQNCEPRVFRQEFLAEFVDWSSDSLFDISKWFIDGEPVDYPELCDCVFAVMDTAVKGGQEHDGSGVTYFAYRASAAPERRLIILDWDVVQIDGALLEEYLPHVFNRLNEISAQCVAINGNLGLFIEDASMGSILIQKAAGMGWPVTPIESKLTSKGKDERGIMASGYHYRGLCKISRYAYEKVAVFKGETANHLYKQVSRFHLADKNAHKRADDLLDTYMYGLLLAFGDNNAL